MASLNSLKARLSSVTSTQKVVKAMELVASSKIRKAREKAQNVKFFQETIENSMNALNNYVEYNNIIRKNIDGKVMYVVITSDMGLAGPYNINVIKRYLAEVKGTENFETIVVGGRGQRTIEHAGHPIEKSIVNYSSEDELAIAQDITNTILPEWKNHELSAIKIIYTDFITPLQQEVKVLDLLDASLWQKETRQLEDIEIEPDPNQVFQVMFEQYILALVYTTLLKSLASEHSYRRNSMDTANTNSLELIDELNLELNRVRQSMITQEITEIIGGSESSKKE